MGKLKYQIGDEINNEIGLSFHVEKITSVPFGTQSRSKTQYHATCSICGYTVAMVAGHLEKRKSCPGCEEQPAAVKTDDDGNCIAICEIGTVEFVREYQEKHKISERKAVKSFIEIVRAKLSVDDPVMDKMTESSIRSKIRRNTGKDKKKVPPKVAHNEPEITSTKSELDSKTYPCLSSVAGVQNFLNKYLPGYKIVHGDGEHNAGII